MSKTELLALLVGLGGSVASCDPFQPRACTLIGCESGLSVVLEGTPAVPYSVTASAVGGETMSIECSGPGACGLFFQGFTAAEVTITYESGGQTVERTFSPDYVRSQPNGEGCPPECLNGTVVLELTG